MHFNYFLNSLENDQELYNIKIDNRLTVLNSLHGKRLFKKEFNNQMSTEEDKEISLLMVGKDRYIYSIVFNRDQEVFNCPL